MTDGTRGFGEPIRVPPDQEDKPNRTLVVMSDCDHTVLATIATALAGAGMVIVTDVTMPPQDDTPLKPYRSRVGLLGVGGTDGNRPSIRDIFNVLGDGDVEVVFHPVEPPMLSHKQVIAERHRNDTTWRRPNKHDRKKLRRGR